MAQVAHTLVGREDRLLVRQGAGATLVAVAVGSDGLFNYVPRGRIVELARAVDLAAVPEALVAAARLRDGSLWDDVSIVALRPTGARDSLVEQMKSKENPDDQGK